MSNVERQAGDCPPALASRFLVGVRDQRPALLEAARALISPVLISANAFNTRWSRQKRDRDVPFPGFSRPIGDGRWKGLQVALDSGGFTAASLFGDFHFLHAGCLETYVDLAQGLVDAGADLLWWAAPDLCVEPELAHSKEELLCRLARNAWVYQETCQVADHRGFRRPIPVLQGQTPEDYLLSADLLFDGSRDEIPDLIGLGSMCRRHAGDLISTLSAIDRLLPPHARVHLFGVTSDAMAAVAGFDRVASSDSQAYDLIDRRRSRADGSPRSNASLVDAMKDFVGKQRAAISRPAPAQVPLTLPLDEPLSLRCSTREYRLCLLDLLTAVRNGEIDTIGIDYALKWGLPAQLNGTDASWPAARVRAAVHSLFERWGQTPQLLQTG